MSGTVLALFGITLGASLLELLVPGDEKNGPKRFLQFFTVLLVILIILRPVADLPQSGGFLSGEVELGETECAEDYEKIFINTVNRRSLEELEARLGELLEQEFGLTDDRCEIAITTNDEGELERIFVRLVGKGLLQDPAPIRERIKELFDCEVEVR